MDDLIPTINPHVVENRLRHDRADLVGTRDALDEGQLVQQKRYRGTIKLIAKIIREFGAKSRIEIDPRQCG